MNKHFHTITKLKVGQTKKQFVSQKLLSSLKGFIEGKGNGIARDEWGKGEGQGGNNILTTFCIYIALVVRFLIFRRLCFILQAIFELVNLSSSFFSLFSFHFSLFCLLSFVASRYFSPLCTSYFGSRCSFI